MRVVKYGKFDHPELSMVEGNPVRNPGSLDAIVEMEHYVTTVQGGEIWQI